jgi:hypothetical protein
LEQEITEEQNVKDMSIHENVSALMYGEKEQSELLTDWLRTEGNTLYESYANVDFSTSLLDLPVVGGEKDECSSNQKETVKESIPVVNPGLKPEEHIGDNIVSWDKEMTFAPVV